MAALGGLDYDRKPTCYVIGLGNRGYGYAELAKEGGMVITGCADVVPETLGVFRKQHPTIPEEYVCSGWEELLALPKNADFVIVATQDQQHANPTIAALGKGYHVPTVKPMATTIDECIAMHKAAQEANRFLGVCHVLRYTPYTKMVKRLVSEGRIGELRNVDVLEPVGNAHFAHAYVRGNWGKQANSSHVIMAKTCHDVDWLLHIVGDRRPLAVTSVATLNQFTKVAKPDAAGDAKRCVDCDYASECPYAAPKYYLEKAVKTGMNNETPKKPRYPNNAVVKGEVMLRDIEDAIEKGPYGRCVYECDNDQPDNVSTIIQFEGGVHATLTMRSQTKEVCQRHARLGGPDGELVGDMFTIELCEFNGQEKNHKSSEITPKTLDKKDTLLYGHWGADFFMLNAFCHAVSTDDFSGIANSYQSLVSHTLVFAIIESATTGKTVNVPEWALSKGVSI